MKRFYLLITAIMLSMASGLVIAANALQEQPIPASIVDKVGGRAFFDSAAALAFGMPAIDTMPTVEILKNNVGWTCWTKKWVCPDNRDGIFLATHSIYVHVSYDYGKSGTTRRVWEEQVELTKEFVRGVALHEFGHWLSVTQPGLMERFRELKGTSVTADGVQANEMLEWYMDELFADAFAQAVFRKGFPEAMAEPYRFYQAWITPEQVAFMDSVVRLHWDRLP